MTNLLSSINTALSSLLSQQTAISITENNVANVNTPGYHRQGAVLNEGPAVSLTNSYYGTGAGQMGSGVLVSSIQRYAVDFYDTRYRASNQESSKWSTEKDIVTELESTLAETSTDGLLPKLDAFFNEWQEVANNPSDTSVRREMLDSAKELASSINSRSEQITSISSAQDLSIDQKVQEINSDATSIANLNREISRVLSLGDSPNDLLDARDLALDRLSELAGATSFKEANGEVSVSIAGHILVGGHESYTLQTEPDANNNNLAKIVWSDGKVLTPTSGELAGVLDSRDVFKDQLTGLNNLAASLKDAVNSIHKTGYGLDNTTGLDFFVGNDAGDLAVNSVLDDVTKIGASSAPGEIGNSDIATSIYELRTATKMNSNTSTFDQFYNGQISKLGLTVQRATTNASNSSTVASAIKSQRESVSGVDLNEEAANMVKSQKAYEAAARIITTIDSMLNTVINQMGVGG
jgi:flagellar hook-associated protein 1 FlgK